MSRLSFQATAAGLRTYDSELKRKKGDVSAKAWVSVEHTPATIAIEERMLQGS